MAETGAARWNVSQYDDGTCGVADAVPCLHRRKYGDIATGWSAGIAQAIDEIQNAPWFGIPWTSPWSDWTDVLVQPGQYRLCGNMVQLRGLAKRNAATTGAICVLPAGFRPPVTMICAMTHTSPVGHCRVDINGNGTVTIAVGQTLPDSYATLDGISFSVKP